MIRSIQNERRWFITTLRCSLSGEARGEAGGRTAAVSLEVELSAETMRRPALIKKHIKCGFDRVRAAIEEEPARPDGMRGDEGAGERPPGGRPRRGGDDGRPVTPNQFRLLKVLAGRGEKDLTTVCRDRFGKGDAAKLSTGEASRLIDELNGSPNPKRRR